MPPTPRAALLDAVMMRNNLVRETPLESGGMRLTAPIERSALGRVFGGGSREKTFELDTLGLWVWQRINGTHSVEQLIAEFATEQRVNLREAEVAVIAFLKMLVKRGLVALAVPDPAAGESPA